MTTVVLILVYRWQNKGFGILRNSPQAMQPVGGTAGNSPQVCMSRSLIWVKHRCSWEGIPSSWDYKLGQRGVSARSYHEPATCLYTSFNWNFLSLSPGFIGVTMGAFSSERLLGMPKPTPLELIVYNLAFSKRWQSSFKPSVKVFKLAFTVWFTSSKCRTAQD